jgi:hypothetical protein
MIKIAILMGALFLCTLSGFAQNQIKGRVMDADGNPLGNVSVKIKGYKYRDKYEA